MNIYYFFFLFLFLTSRQPQWDGSNKYTQSIFKDNSKEGVNGVPLKSVISKILAKKSVISKI